MESFHFVNIYLKLNEKQIIDVQLLMNVTYYNAKKLLYMLL